MTTVEAQVSTKYQVVLPKEVREKLKVKPHSTVLFLIDGDTSILRPRPSSFTAHLRGLHQKVWDDVDTWLAEERATWA